MPFIFSKHALDQMNKRGLGKELVIEVLNNPGEIVEYESLKIFQSLKYNNEGVPFLIRVFVNPENEPGLVVTAYKTSKIRKYYEGKV
jgi:hypothetical protein